MNEIETARATAQLIHARVARARVAVRSAFIVSLDPAVPPPMTLLLRGGRGGEVKLKLLLSMLWIGVKEPYNVTQPARVWAELIGLPDPEVKGAARVNAAVRRLVEAKFLKAQKRPGLPSELILEEETGRGARYTHPGSHWEQNAGKAAKNAPHYTQLPVGLWVNGWMAALSGPALAMLLVLLEQTRGKKYDDLWFSPSVAAKRYGLSETTRRKGIDELAERHVIIVDRVPVGRGTLSAIRQRNTYSINMHRLEERPDELPDDLKRLVAAAAARKSRKGATVDVAAFIAEMNAGEPQGASASPAADTGASPTSPVPPDV